MYGENICIAVTLLTPLLRAASKEGAIHIHVPWSLELIDPCKLALYMLYLIHVSNQGSVFCWMTY